MIGARAERKRPFAVERFAEGVHDAAEPGLGRPDHRVEIGEFGLAAQADAFQLAERQEQGAALAEADHLAGNPALSAGDDGAARPYGEHALQSDNLDEQTEHTGHPSVELIVGNLVDFIDQAAQR